MKSNDRMYAVSRNDGLDIIVRRADGTKVYIGRHRWNRELHTFLKNGKTAREIAQAKNARGRSANTLANSLKYITSVADYALAEAA